MNLPTVAAAAALLLVFACTEAGSKESAGGPETKRAARAVRAATDKTPLVSRSRKLMGTVFTLSAAHVSEAKAQPALLAGLQEIARLETLLSEWLEDSEISRINRAAGRHPVEVGSDTFAVVEAGVRVSAWSEGAFDLSWAALRGLYLFQPGARRIPRASEIRGRLPLVNYRDIVLDKGKGTVFLRRRGMKIGTGGIAKGYALDRAGRILTAAGIDNYMLFGGGQVQVRGRRDERPWRVGIQHPRATDYIGFLELSAGSLSTSGDYEHAFVVDGERWHHIIDPRDGLPVPHTSSVTVVAASGLYADALSTAVFVLGPERAFERRSSAPVGFDAVVLDREMRLWESANSASRLVLKVTLEDGKLPMVR
ncbi:MAG: FAD:protein FMN transferase [Proteobacteria bacterium]|nr:FAD:protein FMN transferase [Pseudomonadota bacterium]